MKYDYATIYNKNAAFLNARRSVKRVVVLFNQFASYFIAFAYLLLVGYAAFKDELSSKALAKLIYLPATALITVSALRILVDKPRPFNEAGARITPLHPKKDNGSSFPSRHLTCAAVISTVLLPFFPAASVLSFVCTAGLGYSRFALGWHYPSDLIVGFALGVGIGCGVFIF